MLCDPKRDKKVKADPLSLSGLVEWLETMPPTKTHCYIDTHNCLLAQYFRAQGYRGVFVGPFDFHYRRFLWPFWRRDLPDGFNDVAHEHAFGTALERARASLRPVPSTHTTTKGD